MNVKKELIEAGKYLKTNQLAWGTSGNISAKSDDNHMLITASGTYMADLKEDDFVTCEIETGKYEGTRKASKETPMHTGIYRMRKDVKAVLHSSPFYTTLFACSNEQIYSELFVETMYYLENIAYVDYFHPGTQELGDAVTEQATKANIIMLKNHGVVVYDDSMSEAIMRLETLEMACRMILKAKESGVKLNHIPDQVVTSFLEDSRYKPRKKLG
ncbi:class II aldolase/adducin family protein [Metabacillus bambusae]|uniref:Class II aldolase/adducin family protein n=1 Tax=Metabacillus bambusae TaxID=2795218 RepID=A0ABS3MZP1_9BACI|nr:class II aldolase/adducin family protein [Metabacillus bambusae]MBO1511492.1 class II aldolase/adducin family protein [Metabacillus bambusae]